MLRRSILSPLQRAPPLNKQEPCECTAKAFPGINRLMVRACDAMNGWLLAPCITWPIRVLSDRIDVCSVQRCITSVRFKLLRQFCWRCDFCTHSKSPADISTVGATNTRNTIYVSSWQRLTDGHKCCWLGLGARVISNSKLLMQN
jgi:hypothetical protein